MWFDEAVIYQIYPLGLCGAPKENDGVRTPRHPAAAGLGGPHQAAGSGHGAAQPVFDSDRHGYDTRDYFTVDPRLGSDEDLAQVCLTFHQAGIR